MRQLSQGPFTDGVHFADVFVPAEVVGEDDEEVPLSVDELRHDADHIDVAVEAVGLETVAAEHLEAVTVLLEVEIGLLGVLRDVLHPLAHHLRQLGYDTLLRQRSLPTVVVILVQNQVQVGQVLLVVVGVALCADYLVRVFEFLEVLVRRQTVGLGLQKIHC